MRNWRWRLWCLIERLLWQSRVVELVETRIEDDGMVYRYMFPGEYIERRNRLTGRVDRYDGPLPPKHINCRCAMGVADA